MESFIAGFHGHVSHDSGVEQVENPSCDVTNFSPASHPQPHTLTWHTCRHSPHPAGLASQTAPAPALCLQLAARTEERLGHEWPLHTTTQLSAKTLAPRDNTVHEHGATDCIP